MLTLIHDFYGTIFWKSFLIKSPVFWCGQWYVSCWKICSDLITCSCMDLTILFIYLSTTKIDTIFVPVFLNWGRSTNNLFILIKWVHCLTWSMNSLTLIKCRNGRNGSRYCSHFYLEFSLLAISYFLIGAQKEIFVQILYSSFCFLYCNKCFSFKI